MQITKENARIRFADLPKALSKIEKITGDYVYFDLQTPEAFKTSQQNRLFHSLLSTFFASGCDSFGNYDDMRLYYKRVAGLVKKQGNFLVESSWSEATKEQAKTAIDMIIRDMDLSGVIGSSQGAKYEQILKGIKQIYEEF